MSSIYDERLQHLASGYFRESIGNSSVPDSISVECAKWMRDKVQFTARKYHSSYCNLPLQIYLEPKQFADKILNHNHIKRYRINYRPDDMQQSHSHHIFTSKIYPFHCLSYTAFDDISFENSGFVLIQIIALDHEDRVIEESEQQSKYVHVNSIVNFDATVNYDAIREYWKTNMVAEDRDDNVVNVDQWVDALKRNDMLNASQPEMINDCKRIFYYILFQSGSNRDVMECKYFEEFVDCGDAGEYNCNIDWCIGSFQKKIPNFRISLKSDEKLAATLSDSKKSRKCTIL